jgi:caa(3)-type oxidase subunit IV
MARHSAEEIAHEHRRYLQVFAWLAVLTAGEIGVIYMPIARLAIGVTLVVLAATKATMVALFYMHLANEKKTLMYIALSPAVLCVFLCLMLLPDLGAFTRALTHASPAAAEHAAEH